jgi:hypothetical protein
LNIFSEYNERLRMTEYKKAPGKTDDAFHSIVYLMLASMPIRIPGCGWASAVCFNWDRGAA